MPDLKAIYRAETAEAAAAELDAFEAEWGKRYPAIGQAWRRAWQHVVPLFAFPPAIRKMIYTTNAVESLNRSLRKIIKTRGSFPTDEAALKLLFPAIRKVVFEILERLLDRNQQQVVAPQLGRVFLDEVGAQQIPAFRDRACRSLLRSSR